jgi:hypothetical protein
MNKKIDGFNLLKKWVPGTETLTRPALLMSAVNYIKELLNKVKELEKESLKESTPLTDCETVMEQDSVPNTEQDCTDSALREPLMPEINSSPMETDIWEPNSSIEQMMTDLLQIGVNLEEEEELPEFNSIEDLRKWLGV